MCCIKQVLFVVQIIIRDSRGLSEDQMKELRSFFNHFDKACRFFICSHVHADTLFMRSLKARLCLFVLLILYA